MAPVLSEEVQEVEPWQGYVAVRKTVRFHGLTLGLVTFSDDPYRYLVDFAQIRTSTWSRIAPFKIDQPIAAVRRKLGSTGNHDPLLLAEYSGETDSIGFETRAGRVVAIVL